MSLGEAFVEIHADLRPFARDLQRNVKPMVEAFEREINGAVGRAMLDNSEENGRKVGDRVSRGIKRSLGEQTKNKNIFLVLASSLASALDDGISALPTEVKAALVAGLLAAAPLVAGALAGMVSAGIGAGLVGLGVLLGAQFDSVQTRGIEFGRNLRAELVSSAGDFEFAIFNAFDIIESRVRRLRPVFDEIFNVSSNFLEPLLQGALDLVESLVMMISRQIDNLKPFVDELGAAFATLGDAIALALEILVSTGEDGRKAFRDLIVVVGVVAISVAALIFILTKLYGAFRTVIGVIADILGPMLTLIGVLDFLFDLIDKRTNANKSFINTNTDMENSFQGLIAATNGETDALEAYQKKLEGVADAAKSNLELNVAWEDSLDRISEALKENGRTLDVHTDKGRNNINEFLNGLKIAEERALLRVQRGEMTADQASAQYELEINQLRRLATQAGLSEKEFNDLFNEIITTSKLRIDSEEMGVDELNEALGKGVGEASRLYDLLKLIQHLGKTVGAGAVAGVRGFADGGMHYLPETVRVAEDGPEVTLPLTKPARAAALLAQSGLAPMLGDNSIGNIFVYVGNEQLDSRTVRIVKRNNDGQARELAQGPRRF